MKPVLVGLLLAFAASLPAFAAGKQLTGQYAPTATPALAPEEAQKKFTVPEGFEVRLFAAEPDVINPVAMTWDERGRLWVLELYEYPLGAPAGQKGRDRIRILEDTDNDGRADKVTLFADGLNLATGLALGNGGVYVGQAPDLLFLQDTNHDDKADTRKVLMTGFGLEDRHELLNGFTWGPDGWLYMTHGVFTHSKVKIPEASAPGVEVTAALARYQPRTRQFEVFAEGTSNPWGVDFDEAGNAFVSACVIDHLFHLAPGGTYQRQAGAPSNPYAYEILPSIVQHKHHMAAYCGICVYQGNQFPEEYRGRVFMGNIHQNAINHDRLIPNGSSFKAVAEKDFLTSSDGWFRPISEQVGPDGALWIGDWSDKYPCYQNAQADPEGVDRTHGRIWRVVYVGKDAGKKVPSRPERAMDLRKLDTTELVKLLEHPNIWQRRMAQRVLSEFVHADGTWSGAGAFKTNPMETVEALARSTNADVRMRLAALWTLHSFDHYVSETLDALVSDSSPEIRTWVARLTGERATELRSGKVLLASGEARFRTENLNGLKRLEKLASDTNPAVRLAAATAVRQIVSGSLTVNTPSGLDNVNVSTALDNLVRASASAKDPLVNYMIWLAGEPLLARKPEGGLKWLADNGAATMPLSGILIRKSLRRLCDTSDQAKINLAAEFLDTIADKETGMVLAALDGLIEGQQARPFPPTTDTKLLFAKLNATGDEGVKDRARRLGALWNDAVAVQATMKLIRDPNAPAAERIQAIRTVRLLKTEAARETLSAVLMTDPAGPLAVEIIRALGDMGGDTVAEDLVKSWVRLSPEAKLAATDVLVTRRNWAIRLLTAVETKAIAASELPMPTVRVLAESKDDFIRTRAAQAIGRIRPANADKQKIIAEKKQMIVSGKPDLRAGHELAKKTCFVCHKLNGEGAEVGPDLTGSGRSTLDALLANVIDPNQVIGKGYENVTVDTKDDRSISGRLVEDTPTQVKLLSAGPKEEIIAKKDIAQMRTSEFSVMPEGLEQMPDADFRNLISYILNPDGESAAQK